MSASSAERHLARTISRIRREMREQGRGAQAAYRAVELTDGPVLYYGEAGEPLLSVGPTDDGTFTVMEMDPTPPPTPTEPDIVVVPGGVRIVWDGTYEDGNTPANYARCEIHALLDPADEATDATQINVFTSPNGGDVFYALLAEDGARYFCLVAVNRSETESPKSLTVEASGGAFPPPDPIAPTASPIPILDPGIRQMNIRWLPVDGTDLKIEVHMPVDDATPPTLHDPATLLGEAQGTGFIAIYEPDGVTELVAVYDDDGLDTTPDVPKVYNFATIAYNDTLPAGAPPSPIVSGSLRQITGPDTNVNAVWAGFVHADHLLAGDLDVALRMTAHGRMSVIGSAGESIALSAYDGQADENDINVPKGLSVKGATSLNNPTYVHFPIDGRPNIIGGQLNADTLSVSIGATFRGISQMEPGAEWVLNDSITAPIGSPVLESVAKTSGVGVSLQVLGPASSSSAVPYYYKGGAWHGGKFWFIYAGRNNFDPGTVGAQIYSYNPSTNTVLMEKSWTNAQIDALHGTAGFSIAGIVRIANGDGFDWRVFWSLPGLSARCTRFNDAWAQTGVSTHIFTPDVRWALVFGSDGADIWIGHGNGEGGFSGNTLNAISFFRVLGQGDSAVIQETIRTLYSPTAANGGDKFEMQSLQVGNFDFGARKFVLGLCNTGETKTQMQRVFSTTGARETANEWTLMGGSTQVPLLWWDSAVSLFYDLAISNSSGALSYHQYTNTKLTGPTQPIYGDYTFYRSSDGAETPPSLQATLTMNQRWWWKITIGTPPAGLGARVYVGLTSGVANSKRQPTAFAAGVISQEYQSIDTTGAAPPTSSTFGSVTPAWIHSQATFTKLLPLVGRTNGSVNLTGTNRFRTWMVGQTVTGTGVPAATTIATVTDQDHATLSNPSTSTVTDTLSMPNQPVFMARGDGQARIKELDTLIISSQVDATTGINNQPPLRIGDTTGVHQRLDGDEIIAMNSDTVQGTLRLNALGAVQISRGAAIAGIDFDRNITKNTDANGRFTVNHALDTALLAGFATPRSAHQLKFQTASATQITFEARTAAGVILGSGVAVNFDWFAIRV